MLLVSNRCRSTNICRPAELRIFIWAICYKVIGVRVWSTTKPLSLFNFQLSCTTFTYLGFVKKLGLCLWCHCRIRFCLLLKLLLLLGLFWLYQVWSQHFTCVIHWSKVISLIILIRYLESRWNLYNLFYTWLRCCAATWWNKRCIVICQLNWWSTLSSRTRSRSHRIISNFTSSGASYRKVCDPDSRGCFIV